MLKFKKENQKELKPELKIVKKQELLMLKYQINLLNKDC